MSVTTRGYSLGLTTSQGISFSENTGTAFPMPEARTGVLRVIDSDDQPHILVLDFSDGKWYDVTPRDGPTGSAMMEVFTDKANISGTGGTNIVPEVWFKEDRGSVEKFYLEHLNTNLYIRPGDEENRNTTGYDASGFPTGIEFDSYIYVDGEPFSGNYRATASDIGIKGDISYDRAVQGHRLQSVFKASKSDFQLVGRHQSYIAKDIPDEPDRRLQTEDTSQSNLGNPIVWFTRNNLYYNRVAGASVSGSPSGIYGPDNKSDSAFEISGQTAMSGVYDTYAKTVLYWVKGSGSGVLEVKIGGSLVSGINYSGANLWYLNYASGISDTGAVTMNNKGMTVGSFDFRIYSGNVVSDVGYYYRDVTANMGDTLLPMF